MEAAEDTNQTEFSTIEQCPINKFGEGESFWAESHPPNPNGGGMEQNCVSMQIYDARFPKEKNWIGQRCDDNPSGRDSYVCMQPIPTGLCGSGSSSGGNSGNGGTSLRSLHIVNFIILFVFALL